MKKSKSIVVRLVMSIAAIFAYGWVNYLLNPVAVIGSGIVAGKQFELDNTSYVVSQFGMDFFRHLGISFIVLLAVLIWIWFKPLQTYYKSLLKTVPAILIVFLLSSVAGNAYYAKEDYTEPYYILPNESAFWIPDVGDNKTSQAKMGSEQYLRDNKIAAKRFVVPHTKLENSGLFTNFYVPAGRLIIVDRTPFNREWTKSVAKGTAAKDEGFEVQSKEGINITAGVSIAAAVFEEDSPKFLYRYGVKPPAGDRKQPEVIFTSVYYGRSLAEVMDSVIRSKVQALLGSEFTKRTFDQCNQEADAIMTSIEAKLKAYAATFGITLDYIGWAATFEFDHEIQSAINRRYIAIQDEDIAQRLGKHTDTIQALALAETLRSFGNKTDGKLPTTMSLWWLPSGMADFFGKAFKGSITPPATVSK
jgi:hypothetical protein